MTAAMQRSSRSAVALALRRNSSNTQDELPQDPACERLNDHGAKSSPVKPSPSLSPSNNSFNTSASVNIAEMIKIFVLLLEPKTKTFELIQLVYPSATTTIGDILRMIPQHATELALGSQKYVGLCRPKDEHALSNLSLLASAAGTTENSATTDSASICAGEILVSIPSDYSVQEVAKFSQAILTNRRFTKLLRRNNPLSPKMRKHSDRKRDRKNKHHKHHRSRDAVHILERHDEAAEEAADDDQMMQRAMEKAATAAAKANANIPLSPSRTRSRTSNALSPNTTGSVGSLSKHLQKNNRKVSPTRSPDAASTDSSLAGASYDSSFASFSWIDGGASTYSSSTGTGDSLGESISSWSKSLDASFAKTGRPQHSRHKNVPGTPPRVMRMRKQPKSNTPFWVGALAVLGIAYLVGVFWMDPAHEDLTEQTEAAQKNPMGLLGMLLVVGVLCVLRKIQFLSNRRQRRILNKNYVPKPPHQSACPAVRIHAKFNKLFS